MVLLFTSGLSKTSRIVERDTVGVYAKSSMAPQSSGTPSSCQVLNKLDTLSWDKSASVLPPATAVLVVLVVLLSIVGSMVQFNWIQVNKLRMKKCRVAGGEGREDGKYAGRQGEEGFVRAFLRSGSSNAAFVCVSSWSFVPVAVHGFEPLVVTGAALPRREPEPAHRTQKHTVHLRAKSIAHLKTKHDFPLPVWRTARLRQDIAVGSWRHDIRTFKRSLERSTKKVRGGGLFWRVVVPSQQHGIAADVSDHRKESVMFTRGVHNRRSVGLGLGVGWARRLECRCWRWTPK